MTPSYGPLQAIQLLSEIFLSKGHSLWNIRPFRDFSNTLYIIQSWTFWFIYLYYFFTHYLVLIYRQKKTIFWKSLIYYTLKSLVSGVSPWFGDFLLRASNMALRRLQNSIVCYGFSFWNILIESLFDVKFRISYLVAPRWEQWSSMLGSSFLISFLCTWCRDAAVSLDLP